MQFLNRDVSRSHHAPGGIDHDKTLLIASRHGANWNHIFSILFPGREPIPSPCKNLAAQTRKVVDSSPIDYEASNNSTQEAASLSPDSQNLETFDVRRTIELPTAIEAELRIITNTELAPVEAGLRLQVEDIVRRCLARLAASPLPTREKTAGSEIPQEVASPILDQANTRSYLPPPVIASQSHQASVTSNASTTYYPPALNFYEEPPYLAPNIPSPMPYLPFPMDMPVPSVHPYSDSGYESSQSACHCYCHRPNAYANPMQSNIYSTTSLQQCGYLDVQLTFIDIFGRNLCSSFHSTS